MKRSISLVLAVILAVSALFCFTSCSDKQKLNFGKELLAVTSQLDALNGLKRVTLTLPSSTPLWPVTT